MCRLMCINDKNIPNEIPLHKRVKEGETYTAIHVLRVMPQNEIAVWLEEIDLDESCAPYEYWLMNRFAIYAEDADLFEQMLGSGTIEEELKIKEFA
jgi:hypothetical protein